MLRRDPRIGYYFRYRLRSTDLHEVREGGRLLGRFAAKPLYGRLTPEGRVDRRGGFDGRIAVLFVPARARTARRIRLLFTRMSPERMTGPNGRRNWPRIRAAAERAVRRELCSENRVGAARG